MKVNWSPRHEKWGAKGIHLQDHSLPDITADRFQQPRFLRKPRLRIRFKRQTLSSYIMIHLRKT